ncbi:hypothetical protein [Alicyclobacillus sp.]|uniref:hypothetical protein n=1 Tax=Alicyclobacillus sp. TaxID=61169 RepID=UPI0025B97664|nr:hypothetical protein [Alicyclobacillus sp.]MCL6516749.1 hypothetical protein [Alicyclobacillus sp.]
MDEKTVLRIRDWSRQLDEILSLGNCLLQLGDRAPSAANVPGDDSLRASWWKTWLERDEALSRLQESVEDQGGLEQALDGVSSEATAPPSPALLEVVHKLRVQAAQAVAQNQALDHLLRQRMSAIQEVLAHLRQAETFQQRYRRNRLRPAAVMDRRG